MQSLNQIQDKIKQLCSERYQAPGDFIIFTNALMELGVVRQTYDVIENHLYFYSKDELLYQLAVQELHEQIQSNHFEIGDVLEEEKIKNAIQAFDVNQSSVVEFHQQVANSGVVYVIVYLPQKKIYYMGQDAQYYLECYEAV